MLLAGAEPEIIGAFVESLVQLGPVVTILGVVAYMAFRYIINSKDREIERLYAIIERREVRIENLQTERNQVSDRVIVLMDQTARLLESIRNDATNQQILERLRDLKEDVVDAIKTR